MSLDLAVQRRSPTSSTRVRPLESASRISSTASKPSPLQRFQRTIGNAGTAKLFRSGCLQPKLSIAKSDEELERQTDRVARQTTQQHSTTAEVSNELDSYLRTSRHRGQPLPVSVRADLEPRFDYNFGNVRVHTDTRAADAARSISAQAFTVGANVYFGSGSYNPASVSGRRLLSHELAHVIQQGNASEKVNRQPETCPQNRHEQAEHRGTCPEIRRERGERRRFSAMGPSVRVIEPLKCYVVENLSIGETSIGVLPALDAIADFLQLNPGATVHLTGFADCLGSRTTNANLRTNRASAVEDYFIDVLRVDRDRVFVEFANDSEYLETNETALGRAANRAVAIYLDLGPAPPPQPDVRPRVEPPRDPRTLSDLECALQVAHSLGTAWLAALPNCPCTTTLVDTENTSLSGGDRWSESSSFLGCFHPGAERCFRRDSGGHAQQCCYDASGNLITAGAAAGTPDFVPSSGSGHQQTDVWTWTILGWERYDEFWAPNNGNGCPTNTVTNASSCRRFHLLLASRPDTCAP